MKYLMSERIRHIYLHITCIIYIVFKLSIRNTSYIDFKNKFYFFVSGIKRAILKK